MENEFQPPTTRQFATSGSRIPPTMQLTVLPPATRKKTTMALANLREQAIEHLARHPQINKPVYKHQTLYYRGYIILLEVGVGYDLRAKALRFAAKIKAKNTQDEELYEEKFECSWTKVPKNLAKKLQKYIQSEGQYFIDHYELFGKLPPPLTQESLALGQRLDDVRAVVLKIMDRELKKRKNYQEVAEALDREGNPQFQELLKEDKWFREAKRDFKDFNQWKHIRKHKALKNRFANWCSRRRKKLGIRK